MQAANITENEETLLTDVDGGKFLPLAVVYGPNGSGKSTFIHALFCLEQKIMRPICSISPDHEECARDCHDVEIKPFKFSQNSKNPTEFEIIFRTALYEYQYQLALFKGKVLYEALSKKLLKGARYSTVFTRNEKEIVLKGSLKNYNYEGISDTMTLLSFFGMTHNRNRIIKDILNWLGRNLRVINYGDPKREYKIGIVEKDAELKKSIVKLLAKMDTGVSDYRTEILDDDEVRVFTQHTVDKRKYELNLQEESSGTKKIFGLLPYIVVALKEGAVLAIDELDAKLHPLLLQYIIDLFNDPKINVRKSQLIFTSHDLSTMNGDNFRRDEIWFTAKDDTGGTKLYSLVNFKTESGKLIRKDERFDKNYLAGRYGADPYFKRLIDWDELR